MTLTEAKRELRAARLSLVKGLGRWNNYMLSRDLQNYMLRNKRLRYERAERAVAELKPA